MLRHRAPVIIFGLVLGVSFAVACGDEGGEDGECSEAVDEASDSVVTITIRNGSDEPLFVESAYPADGVDNGFFDPRQFDIVEGGEPVQIGGTCLQEYSCVATMSCPQNCDPGPGFRHAPLKLAPGATVQTTWDGLKWISVDLPATCRDEGCNESCIAQRAVSGEVTVLARASATITCSSGDCDCETNGDSCTVQVEDLEKGATLDAPVEVSQVVQLPGDAAVELVFE